MQLFFNSAQLFFKILFSYNILDKAIPLNTLKTDGPFVEICSVVKVVCAVRER